MSALLNAVVAAARLGDPDLVILDATLPPVGVVPAPDVQAQYRAQHIPGAVFFDLEALSDENTDLPHMLPTPEVFAREMGRLGLRDGMTLVVYEQAGPFSAPRAWWMLRTFGVRNVYVLDGGLRAWVEAGLPTESGGGQRPEATFHATLDTAAVCDLQQLGRRIESGGQIADARPAGRFAGTAPEPRPGLRSGHMPSARSLPLASLTEQGRFKPAAELLAIFQAQELDLGKPITTTCGSGITAAGLALALELCGAREVSLYDGSWAEYAQQPGAVIKGEPESPPEDAAKSVANPVSTTATRGKASR